MAAVETLVIDNSLDGAAAGAAFLLKHPDARVFVSSAYSLPSRLANLREWDESIASTAVLGIGCKRSPAELVEAMRQLAFQGVSISWFVAGAGHPEHEAAVRSLCTIKKDETAGTLTDAVLGMLELRDHPRAKLLETIARSGRTDRMTDREAKTVAGIAVASMYRFFQLGDREVYPSAVRKLAGLDGITEDDLAMAKRFNAQGCMAGLDGSSPGVKEVRRLVGLYGPLDSLNVLVLGETGTGKERVARLIHQESRRVSGHFLAVNCSTLSNSDLLDSRLFGYVKGAFTGAVADRAGVIEAADKGTLFLDEIGDMPLETQAKLLRVIEDGSFNRLGSTQELKADVRIVAATNRNLAGMVRDGSFRIDLYYRLRELVIRIPPLRDRLCDLGQIVGTIRRDLAAEHGRRLPDLKAEQYELLRSYAWPGNVRQLKSVLQKAFLLGVDGNLEQAVAEEKEEGIDCLLNLGGGSAIEAAAPAPVYEIPGAAGDGRGGNLPTLHEIQRRYAMTALEACGGNLTRTARALDISVNTLKKLRRENQEGQ